ncbi:hypothetical protein KGQ71_03420 [Patescibacteria group bacterium]|nr:hypothetical protein [Patescibacteria group bacterium]
MNIRLLLTVLIAVILTALTTSGTVYGWQKQIGNTTTADLETQIAALREQLATLPTPLPTPASIAIPEATKSPTPVPTPAPVALSTSQLMNFSFKDSNGIPRTLTNGVASYPVAGGTETLTLLPATVAAGNLNGDNGIDEVAILSDNERGTGTYYLLAALINQSGQPTLADERPVLADRSLISSVTVNDGIITVTGKIHGTDQSMADAPNQPATEQYRLSQGTLVKQ